MLKIMRLNILDDEELDKIKNDLNEAIKQVFDKVEFYVVETDYEKKPKCEFCDDDRKVEVELPDGTKKKIPCSCDRYIYKYKVSKLKEVNVLQYKDKDIFMVSPQDFRFYPQNKKLIMNEEQLSEIIYYRFLDFGKYVFSSKELADRAVAWRADIGRKVEEKLND